MTTEIKTITTLAELVHQAYKEKLTGKTSTELMVYKSSGMNETVGSEGAYAVAAQMASEILSATQQKSLCYSKAKILNVTKGKSVKLPYVLDSNVASTVVTAYWPGEGNQKTVSHVTLGQHDLALNTLAVITPVTEELLEDVQQLEGFLQNFVPLKIAQEIDAHMIYGDPASSMWGITSAGAVGVIGVSNGDPITLANMIAYEKALAPASKASAQWYMGTEQYNELLDLIDDTKTNTAYTWEKDGLYIFGHKVNVCNFLKKNQYDLILGDFSDYVVVQRALQSVTSISFKFNLDEKVIRWTIRINGASFGNKVTLEDGSIVAPFVIPAEGPVEESSSSSSDSGASDSSGSSYSNSSDSSQSPGLSESSNSSQSLVSGSSASSMSNSSDSTSSGSSGSSGDSGSSASNSSSSSEIQSRSSASSMSNSSNSSNSSNG
jgi:HK97 family phage major capsid protein